MHISYARKRKLTLQRETDSSARISSHAAPVHEAVKESHDHEGRLVAHTYEENYWDDGGGEERRDGGEYEQKTGENRGTM